MEKKVRRWNGGGGGKGWEGKIGNKLRKIIRKHRRGREREF